MRVYQLLLLLSLSVLIACESPYFESEKKIEDGVWTYDNPFTFTFHADDTLTTYDFNLEVSHLRSYPYQNIYLLVSTVFPDGDTIQDPFSVNLADKYGQWNGNCWGDECNLYVAIQSNVKFKSVGEHTLTFSQYTRQDSLRGINGLAFTIMESEN